MAEIKLTQTKHLLTNFTVDREDEDGNTVRRELPAGTTQKLTDSEVELLERLEKKTGRAHLREPISERVIVSEDDGDDLVLTPQGAKTADGKTAAEAGLTGEKVVPTDEAVDAMTVKDLKAYLDAEPAVEYAASDDKGALQSKAKSKASTARAAADADNSGL